jgi:hypothetical protein
LIPVAKNRPDCGNVRRTLIAPALLAANRARFRQSPYCVDARSAAVRQSWERKAATRGSCSTGDRNRPQLFDVNLPLMNTVRESLEFAPGLRFEVLQIAIDSRAKLENLFDGPLEWPEHRFDTGNPKKRRGRNWCRILIKAGRTVLHCFRGIERPYGRQPRG